MNAVEGRDPMPPFWHRCERLLLREFTPADAPDVQRLHADPRVRALLPDEHPLHEPHWAQEFTACLGGFYRRHPGLGIWRCAVPADGAEPFAGWFSLMPVQPDADTAALGLSAGHAELGSRLMPLYWGGSLALTGGEVLLRHAFDTLKLDAVWGICHPDNRNARACLEALGFVPRARAPYEGQPADYHLLRATAWAGLRHLGRRERLRHVRRMQSHPALASIPSSPPP